MSAGPWDVENAVDSYGQAVPWQAPWTETEPVSLTLDPSEFDMDSVLSRLAAMLERQGAPHDETEHQLDRIAELVELGALGRRGVDLRALPRDLRWPVVYTLVNVYVAGHNDPGSSARTLAEIARALGITRSQVHSVFLRERKHETALPAVPLQRRRKNPRGRGGHAVWVWVYPGRDRRELYNEYLRYQLHRMTGEIVNTYSLLQGVDRAVGGGADPWLLGLSGDLFLTTLEHRA